jgi:predicted ATPase
MKLKSGLVVLGDLHYVPVKLDKSTLAEHVTGRYHRLNLVRQLCSKIHKVDEPRQDSLDQMDRMSEVKLQNSLYAVNQ